MDHNTILAALMLRNRDSGTSGLPAGAKPNQYIVTDGKGNAKWEDKLCWSEEGKVVTWDGSTEGFEVIYNNEVPKFVKVSDDIFTKEGLIGVTMVLCSPSDESQTEVVTLTADWLRESADVISIWPKEGAVIANIATTDAVWNGMNFSKGIWAMIPNAGYRFKSLSSPETIHPIDKKYLPSGGGGFTWYYFNSLADDIILYKDEAMTEGVTIADFESVVAGGCFKDTVSGECYAFGGAGINKKGGFVVNLFYSETHKEAISADFVASGPA